MSLTEYPIIISASDYPVTATMNCDGSLQSALSIKVGDRIVRLENGTQVQLLGNEEKVSLITGKAIDNIPGKFVLDQNCPNPFNPTTRIHYGLPEKGHVTLEIFNVLGQKIETLVDAQQDAGYHTVQWNAAHVSTGIYFYKLSLSEPTGNTVTQVRRMSIIK
jgi:hypothetical protein